MWRVAEMRKPRGSRVRLSLALLVVCAAVVGSNAPTAFGYHHSSPAAYFNGHLGPQQGAASGYYTCYRLHHSAAQWSATGWFVTAAIIDSSGGWIRSSRSSSGYVSADVNPATTGRNKAHCKNAESIYSFSVACSLIYAYTHGTCI
jgi:hypothetical protein